VPGFPHPPQIRQAVFSTAVDAFYPHQLVRITELYTHRSLPFPFLFFLPFTFPQLSPYIDRLVVHLPVRTVTQADFQLQILGNQDGEKKNQGLPATITPSAQKLSACSASCAVAIIDNLRHARLFRGRLVEQRREPFRQQPVPPGRECRASRCAPGQRQRPQAQAPRLHDLQETQAQVRRHKAQLQHLLSAGT
jgi:hypothetical protein